MNLYKITNNELSAFVWAESEKEAQNIYPISGNDQQVSIQYLGEVGKNTMWLFPTQIICSTQEN